MALETKFSSLTIDELSDLAATRKSDGWRFVQMLCVNTDDGIDMIYSFMKDNLLENFLICSVAKEMEVPSISNQFLNAFVFENEAHDLFGVKITDIAIDFAGTFYSLAQKEPMTIITPEQKAAREKAAKIAAKAKEKAGAEAAEGSKSTDVEPSAAEAEAETSDNPADLQPQDVDEEREDISDSPDLDSDDSKEGE